MSAAGNRHDSRAGRVIRGRNCLREGGERCRGGAAARAFAATSVEQGMKPAFLTYLGHDGLVFRRGIVNGRKVWEARKNATGTLNWAPEFAEVAGNADLGWTTGPWEYKPPAGND